MATPRDIAVRFTVTDNEITESLEQIKRSAAGAKTALGEVGAAEIKLAASTQRAAQEYLKVGAAWDASAKFAAKYIKMEQQMLGLRDKGSITEEQYQQAMKRTRDQLAQTFAEEKRITEERRRRIAASPAAQGPSQIISVPATNNLRTARSELEKFHATSRGMLGTINDVSFKFFVLTFAARQVAEVLLRTFVQSGEQVEKFRIRMEALTGSTQVFDRIFSVAQELGVGFEALGQTFNRFAIANRTMGLTNDQLVLMTRNIAALGLIGGGTVQEISSGMQQLGQGMASGKLAGDELRSVMENLPYLALKLAESLGVGVGQLRAMGATGELTGKKMAAAFIAMEKEINKLLEDIPMTSERALAQVANSWSKLVNEALRSVGVETAGESISGISKWIDGLTEDLEANSVAFGRWLGVIKDIAPALLGVIAVTGGLKALTGVGLALATMRENMLRTRTAVAALTVAQAEATAAAVAATAAGNAQAAAENRVTVATAARAISTAKWGRVAMVATAAMNPYVLLLATAAAALYAYSKAEDDATASLDDHIQKLKEMSKYDIQGMSRKQLQGLSGQIAVDIEANNREVEKLYDEKKKWLDKLNNLNQSMTLSATDLAMTPEMHTSWLDATAQKAADAQIELDRLGARQEALRESSTTLKVAQRKVQDAINGVSSAAQDGVEKIKDYSETMKDLEKSLKKSSESLRDVRDEIRLMSLYGVDEGKRMADRQRAVHDYVETIKGALSEDLTPPPMPRTKEMEDEYNRQLNNQRAVLDTAQEELRNQLDLIDAKKVQNEIEEKGREADKADRRSMNRLGSMDDYVPRMEMKKKLDALLAEIAGASQEAVNDAVTRFVTNNNIPARQAEALRYLLTNQIKEAGAKLEIKAADIGSGGLNFKTKADLAGWEKTDRDLRAGVKKLARDMEAQGITVRITSTYGAAGHAKGSKHGTGDAVDIVMSDWKRAADYFNAHASEYPLKFPVADERPGNQTGGTGPHWHVEAAKAAEMTKGLPNLDQWLDDMVRATETGRENMARWVDQNAEMARKNYLTLATITAEGEAEIAKVREQAQQEGISGAVLDERIQLIRAKTAQAQQDLLDQQSDFELETQRMQLETTDIYITDAERRARDVLAIELDAQQAEKEVLANRVITHDEAQRRIDVIWERARSDQRKIEMEELKKVTDDVGMAFGQAFGSLASLEKPRDVLKQLLETLRDMIVQLLIIEPLARAISGYLGGVFGGGAAAVAGGSVVGAGGGTLTAMGAYNVMLAKGGVVSTSLPQGVYSQPTYFPMKTPGLHAFATGTGLLGEAGPEAVMPLTRINGKLGVKADGGGGIKVVVNNNAPGVRVDARETAGGLTLEIVEAHVAASLANGGNRISRAAESAYPGLRRGRL